MSQGKIIHDFGGSVWWFEWECSPKAHVLNTCFPVGVTAGRSVGGAALLENICHWTGLWGFRVLPTSSPIYYVFVVKYMISQLPVPAAMPATWFHVSLPWWTLPSGAISQTDMLYKLAWLWYFIKATGKELTQPTFNTDIILWTEEGLGKKSSKDWGRD